jgi:hypothetical protein
MLLGADGLAHQTPVHVGVKQEDDIQILDGIKAGDKVILSGAYGLPDKTKVKVETAKTSPEGKEPASKDADDK